MTSGTGYHLFGHCCDVDLQGFQEVVFFAEHLIDSLPPARRIIGRKTRGPVPSNGEQV